MQARPFDTAAKWSDILQLEFAKQGEMEKDVGIPTTLFGGPPELGNLTKLANSQIGFMNIFANPLFESIADILPAMQFAVDEIAENQTIWKTKIEEEKTTATSKYLSAGRLDDGFRSPRSGSPNRSASKPELSHPEGLPASGSSPFSPVDAETSTSPQAVNREARRSSYGSISVLHPPTISTSPSHDTSRRSSLGHPFTFTSPSSDSASFSRRSSGAFPAANILSPVLTTRRSSNTVPSQLQLSSLLGRNAVATQTDFSSAAQTDENTYPPHRSSSDTMLNHDAHGAAAKDDVNGGAGTDSKSRHSTTNGDIDSGPTAHHLYHQKYPRPQSDRHSTHTRSNRYSTLSSSQDRYSNATSGAHTFTSHTLPTSPTETQATSVLTDGSDEKHSVGNCHSHDSTPLVVPGKIDVELPGSGYHFGSTPESHDSKGNKVKTTVNSPNTNGGERALRKKSSKFRFDFWKRRGKISESSP